MWADVRTSRKLLNSRENCVMLKRVSLFILLSQVGAYGLRPGI